MTALELVLLAFVIVLIGVCLYLWRAVISKPPKGIPGPIKIPPPPFDKVNLGKEMFDLEGRVTELETPQKYKIGETVYPIYGGGKLNKRIPLLITSVRFKFHGTFDGGEIYRIQKPYWEYTCYNARAKESSPFHDDILGTI